jgi:hypothetical protein
MLPSVVLKYVPFEVPLSASQMRRHIHREHLRPGWVLYLLQDKKFEDTDVDVPALQLVERSHIFVRIKTTCQKSRMLVPQFGLLRY